MCRVQVHEAQQRIISNFQAEQFPEFTESRKTFDLATFRVPGDSQRGHSFLVELNSIWSEAYSRPTITKLEKRPEGDQTDLRVTSTACQMKVQRSLKENNNDADIHNSSQKRKKEKEKVLNTQRGKKMIVNHDQE